MPLLTLAEGEKVNVLFSYAHLHSNTRQIRELLEAVPCRVMIDSGAFTAFTKGTPVDIDEYCAWLQDPPFPFDHAVQLDVIGDAAATAENYEYMNEQGVSTLPVFQRGTDQSVLDELADVAPYILFGGLVGVGGNRPYVKACMDTVGDRANVHWLGYVDLPFIKGLQPHSVDSSRFEGSARWDYFSLYKGFGELATFKRDSCLDVPTDLMESNGVSRAELCSLATDEREWRGQYAVKNKLHLRGCLLRAIDIERRTGTQVYAALTTARTMVNLKEAYEHLTTTD